MGKISEIFNFDNIGGKIKTLTKWSCWIAILLIWIATPITFIILVSDKWTAELCWIPLVGAIVGPIFIWVASWPMYAFGEFVEDIHAMRGKEGTTKEVNTTREVDEKANREAEEKAKHQEEANATRNAEEKSKHDVEEKVNRETKKNAEQIAQKKEKTIPEKLEYALMFQTDDGMVRYLKDIQDETVQNILKSPQHLIREQIQNLLSNM